MANEAAEYIREVWDSLVHGKTNKKKNVSSVNYVEKLASKTIHI